ncbi:MAG: hypothetical protein ABWK01_05775 [Infirmifilum sp.]
MSSLRRIRDVLGSGFVLEVSGPQGSGRRDFAYKLVSSLGVETLYLDYSHTLFRAQGWGGVKFYTGGDPLALLSVFAHAPQRLVVVDSIPRVFHGFELDYRARWGLVASLLALALDRAHMGLGSIFLNYSEGSRSFGEQVFAAYFTHRAYVKREGNRASLKFYHPLDLEFEV